jgi:hypothetical protein
MLWSFAADGPVCLRYQQSYLAAPLIGYRFKTSPLPVAGLDCTGWRVSSEMDDLIIRHGFKFLQVAGNERKSLHGTSLLQQFLDSFHCLLPADALRLAESWRSPARKPLPLSHRSCQGSETRSRSRTPCLFSRFATVQEENLKRLDDDLDTLKAYLKTQRAPKAAIEAIEGLTVEQPM